jgi:RNA polymerase sigma-70 factor (ECF subfamily)
MSSGEGSTQAKAKGNDPLPQTRWSMVLGAGMGQDEALQALCNAYWYPLYVYVRRRGLSEEDAQDRVQGFLAGLLSRGALSSVTQEGGKFRAWLLTSMRHYLSDERARERALKRGGGVLPLSLDWQSSEDRYKLEPAAVDDPEKLFVRRWALTLLRRATDTLGEEYRLSRKSARFEALSGVLTGEGLDKSYAELAADLGITEGAVKVEVHRLRKRYGRVLRREVADTLDSPDLVDEELRFLLASLGD